MRWKLREARQTQGMTQVQLAKLIGKTHPTVCKYESGRSGIPSSTLTKLHEVLGISLDDILHEEPAPAKPSASPRRKRTSRNARARKTKRERRLR